MFEAASAACSKEGFARVLLGGGKGHLSRQVIPLVPVSCCGQVDLQVQPLIWELYLCPQRAGACKSGR